MEYTLLKEQKQRYHIFYGLIALIIFLIPMTMFTFGIFGIFGWIGLLFFTIITPLLINRYQFFLYMWFFGIPIGMVAYHQLGLNFGGRNPILFLVLGLSAPKQEKWLYKHRDRLTGVKMFMCIGAAIYYAAYPSKRAPLWVRKISIEWFYRFLQEPKRFWHRYFIECLPFFYLVLLQILGLYKDPFRKYTAVQNDITNIKKSFENQVM